MSFKRDRYNLNPPLSEDSVLQFENQNGIRLPQDYRGFLRHLGNGGAGPAYGVFKLGEVVLSWDSQTFRSNDGFVGDLAKPFPHRDAWNDYSDEANYWTPIDGAIPISDIGCGSRFWLIVTGAEAGNVWCDERVDRSGVSPIQSKNATRVAFVQWYLEWLANELSCKESEVASAEMIAPARRRTPPSA